MKTIYDVVTVLCFIAMAIGYFGWGRGDQRLLMHLMLPGLAFAIANQLGNRGYDLLAIVVILAGVGYAALMFKGRITE